MQAGSLHHAEKPDPKEKINVQELLIAQLIQIGTISVLLLDKGYSLDKFTNAFYKPAAQILGPRLTGIVFEQKSSVTRTGIRSR
jgi:hypothetical protein